MLLRIGTEIADKKNIDNWRREGRMIVNRRTMLVGGRWTKDVGRRSMIESWHYSLVKLLSKLYTFFDNHFNVWFFFYSV